jgi:hypothetical protein
MELLESSCVRPRQARYQAALRPDRDCSIYSKALSHSTPNPRWSFSMMRGLPNSFGKAGAKVFKKYSQMTAALI